MFSRLRSYRHGTGYVGVGEVIGEAVRINDFLVEHDGSGCRSCGPS